MAEQRSNLLRVLYFLDSVNVGGAEILALDICRNAAKFGISLTFVTSQGGTLLEKFRDSGADFIKLNRKLPIDPKLVSDLRKIIKARDIQIVHGYQAVEAMHLYLASRGLSAKNVLSFHGGTFYDWKNKKSLDFLIPRMDANLVVSESLKKWYRNEAKLDTESFRVVYNGIDGKRLLPTGRSLRTELGITENTALIGMIGNFYAERRKDQLTVCKALPEVFAEIENVHCVFAGKTEKGAEEKICECRKFCDEAGISNRVHFLGARNDVPDILTSLDLFVFSSFHEGLPIAIAEAMLAGVPMIVSDIEPLLEAAKNGKYAEIFETQNHQRLSEKILNLLKTPEKRKALAFQATDFARENFSIEAHFQKLKEIYEEILSK